MFLFISKIVLAEVDRGSIRAKLIDPQINLKDNTSVLLRANLAVKSQQYRHSSIYAVNVGIHKKTAEAENRVNRGYLVCSTKGEENRIEY